MINNRSSSSTSTSTPAMSTPSEQEDFEVVFPPPIDWEDDGWDDDVLPPPPPAVSDDQMSVVSEDLPAESKSQPTKTLDEDRLVPPPMHTSLVSEVEEVAPSSESAATAPEILFGSEILNDNPLDPPTAQTYLVIGEPNGVATTTEVLRGPSQSKPSPIQILDDEVVARPPSYASVVPEVEEAAPRYKSDATIPDGLQVPSEARLKHDENLDYTSTQQTSQEFFYPRSPLSPRPSAPLELTDTDESASLLSAIMNALEPSERTAFLEEQNKILENIQREASNQKASSEVAWNMMVMEKDAALAKRLQEEERSSIRNENRASMNIGEPNETKRGIRNGPRGLFRRPGKSSNRTKTKR